MKRTTLLYALFLSLHIMAQKPETIYSFATELKPVSWYAEQSKLWKAEVDKDPNNAYAWYNYYRATRNRIRLDTSDHRPHEQKVAQNRKIIDDMQKAVPNSFEYNLCRWMIEGNNLDFLPNLKRAEELGKDRPEICSDMMGWGELTRDLAKRDKYAKLWLDKAPYSPGLMYYNYNVLTGLKPNAILLSCGDNDTYPIWMLQSMGIRRDVTVINAFLINIEQYRNLLFKELGIEKWEDKVSGKGDTIRKQNLIRHMAKNTKGHPVYIALTCGDTYTKPVEESLYLTGLAYEYSDKSFDNMALLKKNFEQLYALDYIDKPFFSDISEYYTQMVNCNYVVPMIKLFDHYTDAGQTQLAEQIKNRILSIVKGKEEEAETRKYLNHEEKK